MENQTQADKAQAIGCLVLTVVVIIAGIAFFGPSVRSDAARKARIERAMAGQPDGKITAHELLQAVSDNEYQAEKQYSDKVLVVTGEVLSVSLQTGIQGVYLGPVVDKLAIDCRFPDSANAQLAALHVGDTVSIRGIANTGLGIVSLSQCRMEP